MNNLSSIEKALLATISVSAIFVCLKLTIGGESSLLVNYLKLMARAMLFSFVLLQFLSWLGSRDYNVSETVFLWGVFNCLAVVSLVYSVDKFNSVMALLEYFSSAYAGYFIGKKFHYRCNILLVSVIYQCALVILLLASFWLVSPADVFQSMAGGNSEERLLGLGGTIIHVHSLAMLFLVCLVSVAFSDLNWSYKIALVSISLAVVFATLSRTGVVLALVILSIWLAVHKSSWIRTVFSSYLLLAVIMWILIVYSNDVFTLFARGASMEDLLSGSNRLYIYQAAFSEISNSPFLGFGFDNLSPNGDFLLVDSSYERSSLHNQFLYILVSGGIIGLISFTLFFLSFFVKAVVSPQSSHQNMAFFIVLFVFSMTQDTLANDSTPLQYFTFLLLGTLESRRQSIDA